MNFHQLKAFYYAVKHGSFSAAADALYITQPAVTKQIQQLQATYGVKLLNRFGKKMVPTDAGEILYDFADKIFQFESQAEESLRDFQQRKSGYLRIHASERFGAYYLPFIINLFRKKYPKIHISVNIFPNQEIIENTVKLENDMGFISYPIEHTKLLAQEILEDRLVLIIHPAHPFAKKKFLEPRQLDGQSIVMHERGSASREIVDGFIKRHNISVSVPLELSNNEAIKRAVEEGIGLCLISEHVVSEEVNRKKLKSIPLIDPALIRKFYLSSFAGQPVDITEENLQARIRGNLLMAYSNKFGHLVLTTGNKSEMSVGYATLYGDMAGGFAVIKDVPKTMVYDLSRFRNAMGISAVIPKRVLDRAPTAELRPNQKDEDSLPPYPVLDPILKAYVEIEDRSLEEIAAMGFDRAVAAKVIALVDRSEYKRRQAPIGIKITRRAFGKDRRMPVTNGYR